MELFFFHPIQLFVVALVRTCGKSTVKSERQQQTDDVLHIVDNIVVQLPHVVLVLLGKICAEITFFRARNVSVPDADDTGDVFHGEGSTKKAVLINTPADVLFVRHILKVEGFKLDVLDEFDVLISQCDSLYHNKLIFDVLTIILLFYGIRFSHLTVCFLTFHKDIKSKSILQAFLLFSFKR